MWRDHGSAKAWFVCFVLLDTIQMIGPRLCPVCNKAQCQRLGKVVQPWHQWFDITLGHAYLCLWCGCRFLKLNDGTIRRLSVPTPQTQKVPEDEIDMEIAKLMQGRVPDADIFGGDK